MNRLKRNVMVRALVIIYRVQGILHVCLYTMELKLYRSDSARYQAIHIKRTWLPLQYQRASLQGKYFCSATSITSARTDRIGSDRVGSGQGSAVYLGICILSRAIRNGSDRIK